MRIVTNYSVTAALAVVLVLKATSVWAVDALPPVAVATPAAPTVIAPAAVAPSVAIATPPAATDLPKLDATADAAGDKKGLSNAEDKISDSAKVLAKHLSGTDNVTLDDLNTARQTVAKIEALIEIEKRLSELDKIKNEREGHTVAAVPASALGNPFMSATRMSEGSSMATPVFQPPAMENMDVVRISGSAGHFSALVKGMDGVAKPISVGEKVQGYGTVRDITSSGVVMDQSGTQHLYRVKNIDTVFSNSP